MAGIAEVVQELFGLRLVCDCGTTQYYSGVDDHIYKCCTCGHEFRVAQVGSDVQLLHERNV